MIPLRPETAEEVPASRLDLAIEWLLLATLAFMPLAFGAVAAWSEMVVLASAGVMLLLLTVKWAIRPGQGPRWSWTYLPVVMFLLLAVAQLVPLGEAAVRAVSPNTAREKIRLLGDLPAHAALRDSMTLSFYARATHHDLRNLLAVSTIFFVVVNTYRREAQVRRLLGGIAAVGGGIALLSLAQLISGTDRIYWVVPSGHETASSGTFVNHSNFSQFMNLSIAGALGLLVMNLHRDFKNTRPTLADVLERLGSPQMRGIWVLGAVVILCLASVFLSLSRGGMITTLAAAALTAVVIAAKRALNGRGWVMAAIALAAFVVVLYLAFDAVYDRLATMQRLREAEGGRWQIVKDIAVAWTQFPAVGTGLGTHEVTYPMFDRSAVPELAAHAENEYAQLAEETGLAGLGLLLVLGVMVWGKFAQCIRRLDVPARSAAVGVGYGLAAVLIHSFSDFGQHLPANAGLSAVFCGLLVCLPWIGSPTARPVRPGLQRTFAITGLLLVVGVWVTLLSGADSARRGEGHWEDALRAEAPLRQNQWQGTNEAYHELISNCASAVEADPGNVKYRYWLHVYRWNSISRVRDSQSGQVILTPRALGFVRRIVAELHETRAICPTFGPLYCFVGQLEMDVLSLPCGAARIRTGHALAPCDPTACYVAGALDLMDGNSREGMAKLGRAVTLDAGLFADAVDLLILRAGRPDLSVALAGDNPGRLFWVADKLPPTDEARELARKARARAVALLESRCQEPGGPAGELAQLAEHLRREKKNVSAAEYYRRALASQYDQVGWRMALASVLAEAGHAEEAIHEARICLRLKPGMASAEKLIAELSVKSSPGSDPEK